jgi:hypothetical protein
VKVPAAILLAATILFARTGKYSIRVSDNEGIVMYTSKGDITIIILLITIVRYHIEGSMKLNACILHLAHMVYL